MTNGGRCKRRRQKLAHACALWRSSLAELAMGRGRRHLGDAAAHASCSCAVDRIEDRVERLDIGQATATTPSEPVLSRSSSQTLRRYLHRQCPHAWLLTPPRPIVSVIAPRRQGGGAPRAQCAKGLGDSSIAGIERRPRFANRMAIGLADPRPWSKKTAQDRVGGLGVTVAALTRAARPPSPE